MFSRLIILSICLLTFSFISAQTAKIRGHIAGTDQQPLPGISIQLEPGSQHTQTDDNGDFIFTNLAAGTYRLLASGVGYSAKSHALTLAAGKTVELNLELNIVTSTLTEVSVRGIRRNTTAGAITRMNTPLRDLPQNVQTIQRTLLNDQQAFQLDQVFRNVAGITSTDYYGGFSSRGYTSSASGITTNGIKGSPYPEGQIALLGNIEAVEVIHGPNAILFGPGGMGGNINLVTKQPKKYSSVNAAATYGTFDLVRLQADVSGSINKKKNIYFVTGAAFQNGGSFTDHFDRRNLQIYGSVKWEISSKTSWQLNGLYISDDASNNYQPRVPIYNTNNKDSIFLAPYTFNPGTDSRYKGNNYQLQSIMEHHFSDNWKLGLLLALNESRADRQQYTASGYIRPSDNTVSRAYTWQQINSPQKTINLYAVGKARTWGVKHSFSFGGDAIFSKNYYPEGILQYSASRISVFNPRHEDKYDTTGMTRYLNSAWEKFTYNVMGAYILDQVEIFTDLKLLAGLRYNNYFRRYKAVNPDGSITNNEKPERTENISPRIGLVYQPIKPLSVYLNYNEGFSPHYGNFAEYGGPFDPETSKEYELGVKGEFFNGSLIPFITVYQSTKKNVLQSVPRDGFPYWREAIGEVRSRGIEMGVNGTILKNVYINFNYNYNKTKITESVKPEDIGQLFANSPQNSANGWVKYTFRKGVLKGLFAGSGFQYVDSRYFSNKKVAATNVLEMPAYTIMDAVLGYRFRQYTLQVNGSNLFDKRYALSGLSSAYTPGAPRNYQVTFSYSFR